MMTGLISINKADAQAVALPRPTDAIGSSLRAAFAAPPMPADMEDLLRRLDRSASRH